MSHRLADNGNCPFLSTHSSAISEGVYSRSSVIPEQCYKTDPAKLFYVEMGLLKLLKNKLNQVIISKQPSHIMILADYGHGKSFSLQCIQSIVHAETDYPTVGITLGTSTGRYNDDKDALLEEIINGLYEAFNGLPEDSFPDKENIKVKYNISLESQVQINQHLENFDHAFGELGCPVFIFIDELEKVLVDNTVSDNNKRKFLNNLKTLADIFQNSVSLWVAGTNNVEAIINTIGRDYMQRFTEVRPTFNENETIQYIHNKCKKIVDILPFSSAVMKNIHDITKGNVRFVNKICRELWFISARNKRKVSLVDYRSYLESSLKPYILIRFPNIGNHIINVIADMIIYKKIGIRLIRNITKSNAKYDQVIDFLENNANISVFEKIERSYKIKDDERDIILKRALGVR